MSYQTMQKLNKVEQLMPLAKYFYNYPMKDLPQDVKDVIFGHPMDPAKAIKPEIRIVGVQTENCPAMIKAYEDNVFYDEYPCEDSICDSLIGGIGALSYQMAKDYVDEFIAVSEETVGKAVSFMAKHEKYIVEAGSCVTVAALMDHRDRIGGNNVALVLSGGNIDGALLTELMNKYE